MNILLVDQNYFVRAELLAGKKKMDTDEKAVRKALVKVWTIVLERYARPGVPMPPPEVVYQELLHVGVDAAVQAVIDQHWVVFDWMIREDIEKKIESGLQRFHLLEFIEKVRIAQLDPGMLNVLREDIKRYVMEDL